MKYPGAKPGRAGDSESGSVTRSARLLHQCYLPPPVLPLLPDAPPLESEVPPPPEAPPLLPADPEVPPELLPLFAEFLCL
jgi:hypothetical protein